MPRQPTKARKTSAAGKHDKVRPWLSIMMVACVDVEAFQSFTCEICEKTFAGDRTRHNNTMHSKDKILRYA